MKHYICINERGLNSPGDRYKLHVAVTVHSALKNTDLKTVLIYDGKINDYVKKLEDIGCHVIQHELSFKNDLRELCKKNSVNFDVASGALLRLDIPIIDQNDGYALYTDVDVMFRSNPDFSECHPSIMAAAPEMTIGNYAHINSGVLLINLEGFRNEITSFIQRVKDGNLKTSSGDPYDQGHINDFFRGRMDKLDPIFNWKPYWGFDDKSVIVHWHGVKYPAAKAISIGREKQITNYHPHPELYARSPSGYHEYMREYEELVHSLPEDLKGDSYKRVFNLSPPLPLTKPTYIIGPLHTVRWQWHVRHGVVPGRLPAERIGSIDGAPIWSAKLFEQAKSMLAEGEGLAIMVPDFRFGHGIVLDTEAISGPQMQDGSLAMTPSAMTDEAVRIMMDRALARLQVWHEHFGPRAHYIFWCLFGQQVHDRMSGKYIESGKYCHPIFNYDDITSALQELNIVDLSPLLRRQMHDVRRLFIDSSSHPSQVGYLLLNGLLFDGLDALTAYDRAVAETENELVLLAQQIHTAIGKPVILTGRSIWLDVLMTTLGATGVEKLAAAGLILAPIDPTPGQLPIGKLLKAHPLAKSQPVVIAAGGKDLSTLLHKHFGTEQVFWRRQPVIDWESATEATIRRRAETPHFSRVVARFESVPRAIQPKLADHDVEQGAQGMPSWTGLTSILKLLANLPGTV